MTLPHDEVVPILDFGSQTAQLIARRVRDAGVFSILVNPDISAAKLAAMKPKGIILSGGPASVYEPGAPVCDEAIFDLGVPVLGICYGMQLMCRALGATVSRADHREFGRAMLALGASEHLFVGVPARTTVWMSHGDQIADLSAANLIPLASTDTCLYAAVASTDPARRLFGVQFHPEVTHTPHGTDIIRNFLYEICACRGDWRMVNFAEAEAARIRDRVGDGHVICGLSGGVDSSVAAALIHRAIGDRLTCVFVDTGLLRKNERALVESTFRDHFHIDLRVADAASAFLGDLVGVTEPQEKRRRIGARFIRVFEEAARDVKDAQFLAQGTLYPDVIESGGGHAGKAAGIKLHHNVGGLPPDLKFTLVEPLRDLFKDEVRRLGEVLGLPRQIVWRHPFPGPGLAVRVLGEVTPDRVETIRECDEILLEEIIAAGLYEKTSQVFAVLLPVQSVGVMGDGRTYENAVAIRAVETQDFMSADWSRLPYDVLATISTRIINEVRGVNRVVYDISSKPPATIEWE
ncbi:MAG: glutamine-hydrolyzing GMP synthase [Phycisphaeraceae bacterium]|nr:glutamine-hydrolyzing GMP synthase [Phycisphaeraceae bacterium]MCW5753608.1 glutamine-hydrolyzing GMP synthase [Phycisphaeraceae bacterium]